jgi:phage terminase large subunit-like protein
MKHVAAGLYRKSLLAFVEKAFRMMDGHRLTSESYIAYIVHNLELFLSGDIRNLLINLPGRHLKTFVCSVCFPAFALGLNPSLRFMIVAYERKIAEDIVRQIRELMESDWYKSVFKTRIKSDHSLKNDFSVKGGGRVRAVSIRSITGKGGDIIVLDDPHNAEDWNNEDAKQKVINTFKHLRSRRDGGVKSRMMVVGHRVAKDDLSAYIMEHCKFAHVCLPLVAPEDMELDLGDGQVLSLARGEALRPDAYPPEEIEFLKTQSAVPFWLHYMQALGPQSDDDRLDISDFPFFKGELKDIREAGFPVVLSVDPAQSTKSASRNVIQVYAVIADRYLLLDVFAEKCTFKDLSKKTMVFASRYDASAILVEKTARGSDLIDHLGEKTPIPIHPISPRGSKSDRLRECAPIIRAKRIMIRSKLEIEEAAAEVVAFPDAAYNDHVDALTNFLREVKKLRLPLVRNTGRSGSNPKGIAIARGSDIVRRAAGELGSNVRDNQFPCDQSNHRAIVRPMPHSPYDAGNSRPPAFSFDGKKIVKL